MCAKKIRVSSDVTKIGNGVRTTGNWKRESGNECAEVTRLRIQNGKKDKGKERNKGKERKGARGSVTLVNVSFYQLCAQMTRTFLIEQSPIGTGIYKHEMAPGEKIKSQATHDTIGQTTVVLK